MDEGSQSLDFQLPIVEEENSTALGATTAAAAAAGATGAATTAAIAATRSKTPQYGSFHCWVTGEFETLCYP